MWDKIELAMNPEFEDEEKINPFDMWTGGNFKLKIRNVEGYRNYDKSEIEAASPLLGDDDQLEAIWKKEHSLTELVAPSNFKSYDELKARLHKALGLDGSVQPQTTAESYHQDDAPKAITPKALKAVPAKAAKMDEGFGDDDDESIEFFKKLAQDE